MYPKLCILKQKFKDKYTEILPPHLLTSPTLLDKFWWILLYATDDAIAKLYVTQSFVKKNEIVENFVT